MKPSDLAEYLDQDPCLEDPEPQPTRLTEIERDRHAREVLQMVMDIFPGARWTTRAEYQRAATRRDRKGRRKRRG
jgi:hypothetical protein